MEAAGSWERKKKALMWELAKIAPEDIDPYKNEKYTCTLVLPNCYNWLLKEAKTYAEYLSENEPYNKVKGSVMALKSLVNKLTTTHKPNVY